MKTGSNGMKLGTNLEVRHESDGRIALIFDPKHRGGRSASGKTIIVASSHGNQSIPYWNGEAITIGVNAYVKA